MQLWTQHLGSYVIYSTVVTFDKNKKTLTSAPYHRKLFYFLTKHSMILCSLASLSFPLVCVKNTVRNLYFQIVPMASTKFIFVLYIIFATPIIIKLPTDSRTVKNRLIVFGQKSLYITSLIFLYPLNIVLNNLSINPAYVKAWSMYPVFNYKYS
jgi:hypothetical protein